MDNYPVSVIISIFRELKYVDKCINSLISQTFQSFELILIDDHGCDGAFEKAKKLIEKSIIAPRCRYISHDKNLGIAASRNRGLAEAKGEYIIYLDSDDYFETNLLEELYLSAGKYKADLVISDFTREFSEEISVYAKDTFDQESISEEKDKLKYIEQMLTAKKGCALWNKLIKRKLLLDNEIHFYDNMRDDLSVSPIMVYCATVIAFVPLPLTHFVQYNSNSGTYSFSHLPFVGNALVHLEKFFNKKGVDFRDVLLKYKANTKRKMLLHPNPEMKREAMLALFPEVDKAILKGGRLEPKIQYQLLLWLAAMNNKIPFIFYRAIIFSLLRLKRSF